MPIRQLQPRQALTVIHVYYGPLLGDIERSVGVPITVPQPFLFGLPMYRKRVAQL